MEDDLDISDIGAQLVAASQEFERTPGDLLGELFPYVYDASRRMSTRAISAWLKENHGLQISQPTVSRALRNSERYWQAFAEFIEPAARRVEDGINARMSDFLFDERIFSHLLEKMLPSTFAQDEDHAAELSEIEAAAEFLKQKWFSLPYQTRLQCRRYFDDGDESEGGSEMKP
jgi:hypothetical protein